MSDDGDAAAVGDADQEAAIKTLADKIANVITKGLESHTKVNAVGGIPFSLGGGNDQSFASYLGWRKARPTRECKTAPSKA